jgi:hypothetical protein
MPPDHRPITADDVLRAQDALRSLRNPHNDPRISNGSFWRAHPIEDIVPPSPPINLFLLDTMYEAPDTLCARFGFALGSDARVSGYLVRIRPGWATSPHDVDHLMAIAAHEDEFVVKYLEPGEYQVTMQSCIDSPSGRCYSAFSPTLYFHVGEPSPVDALAAQLGVVFTPDFEASELSLPGLADRIRAGAESLSSSKLDTRTVAMDGRQDLIGYNPAAYPRVQHEPIRIEGTLTPYGREIITVLGDAPRTPQQPVPAGGGWWCYVCQAFTEVSESMADGDVDALCFTCGERNTRRRNG